MNPRNVTYWAEFASVDGKRYKIEITYPTTDQSRPEREELVLGDTPVVLNYDSQDKLGGIVVSKATISLLSQTDGQLQHLYSLKGVDTRLCVYRVLDGGDKLIWQGTLDPESYSEPYSTNKNYLVSLTFSDFAPLKRIKTKITDNLSLRALIELALHEAGLMLTTDTTAPSGAGLTIHSSIYRSTARAFAEGDPRAEAFVEEYLYDRGKAYLDEQFGIGQVRLSSRLFYDKDQSLSLWDALSGVLRSLCLRLEQRPNADQGCFWVYDLNALLDVSTEFDVFTRWAGGTNQEVSTDEHLQEIRGESNITPSGTDANLSSDRVYQLLTLKTEKKMENLLGKIKLPDADSLPEELVYSRLGRRKDFKSYRLRYKPHPNAPGAFYCATEPITEGDSERFIALFIDGTQTQGFMGMGDYIYPLEGGEIIPNAPQVEQGFDVRETYTYVRVRDEAGTLLFIPDNPAVHLRAMMPLVPNDEYQRSRLSIDSFRTRSVLAHKASSYIYPRLLYTLALRDVLAEMSLSVPANPLTGDVFLSLGAELFIGFGYSLYEQYRGEDLSSYTLGRTRGKDLIDEYRRRRQEDHEANNPRPKAILYRGNAEELGKLTAMHAALIPCNVVCRGVDAEGEAKVYLLQEVRDRDMDYSDPEETDELDSFNGERKHGQIQCYKHRWVELTSAEDAGAPVYLQFGGKSLRSGSWEKATSVRHEYLGYYQRIDKMRPLDDVYDTDGLVIPLPPIAGQVSVRVYNGVKIQYQRHDILLSDTSRSYGFLGLGKKKVRRYAHANDLAEAGGLTPNHILLKEVKLSVINVDKGKGRDDSLELTYLISSEAEEEHSEDLMVSTDARMGSASPARLMDEWGRSAERDLFVHYHQIRLSEATHPEEVEAIQRRWEHKWLDSGDPVDADTYYDSVINELYYRTLTRFLTVEQLVAGMTLANYGRRMNVVEGTFLMRNLLALRKLYGRSYLCLSEEIDLRMGTTEATLHEVAPLTLLPPLKPTEDAEGM